MNEQQIRRAWQHGQAASPALDPLADLFASDAGRHAAALDLLARDPRAADLARVALAVGGDAQALLGEWRRVPRSPRTPFTLRRIGGWALAASLMAVALLAVRPGPDQPRPTAAQAPMPALNASERIVAGSFESTGAGIPATAPAAANAPTVFAGGFDS